MPETWLLGSEVARDGTGHGNTAGWSLRAAHPDAVPVCAPTGGGVEDLHRATEERPGQL